jgi:hypothetical protein
MMNLLLAAVTGTAVAYIVTALIVLRLIAGRVVPASWIPVFDGLASIALGCRVLRRVGRHASFAQALSHLHALCSLFPAARRHRSWPARRCGCFHWGDGWRVHGQFFTECRFCLRAFGFSYPRARCAPGEWLILGSQWGASCSWPSVQSYHTCNSAYLPAPSWFGRLSSRATGLPLPFRWARITAIVALVPPRRL